jgi:GTPase
MARPSESEAGPIAGTRAGYVALVGYPNVGKSSLMNRLLDQKLSIVTPLAQTTRERVLGIDTREGVQMVFVDTPGLVDPRYLLHRAMLHAATQVVTDSDVVVLIADGSRTEHELPEEIRGLLRRATTLIVVANKDDIATPASRAATHDWSVREFGREPLWVSATTGAGLETLRERMEAGLPASPFLYPEDEVSSQPVRFFVAELVRETIFELYEKEVPFSVAVRVEEYREAETPVFIRAVIFVERDSQKAILIGSGGSAIKRLGRTAREKIEAFVDAPVYLDLWVKVLPRWRRDPLSLKRLGYELPND